MNFSRLVCALSACLLAASIVVAQQDVERKTIAITYPLDETVSVKFRGTTLLPRLKGEAKVKRAGRRGTRVELNIEDLPRASELVASIEGSYRHRNALVDSLSARIEMELGELEPDEAAVFMEELGIAESGLDRVIALSYRLLGLVSFLTAGPDEVRAWPIVDGASAVDAAGVIHTDLAKGFIRAETVAYEDLLELGSMAEARKAGRLRSEGKTYRVRDGDVIEILFSK